jgi:hypothetical protein
MTTKMTLDQYYHQLGQPPKLARPASIPGLPEALMVLGLSALVSQKNQLNQVLWVLLGDP